MWYTSVIAALRASNLFTEVNLVGAKIRASLDEFRFLDIYFDPTTQSYSYAPIDLTLPYSGDKRLLGWDDYPHEGVEGLQQLASHPHHFQKRAADGSWTFEVSPMRGNVEEEIPIVIQIVEAYLQ